MEKFPCQSLLSAITLAVIPSACAFNHITNSGVSNLRVPGFISADFNKVQAFKLKQPLSDRHAADTFVQKRLNRKGYGGVLFSAGVPLEAAAPATPAPAGPKKIQLKLDNPFLVKMADAIANWKAARLAGPNKTVWAILLNPAFWLIGYVVYYFFMIWARHQADIIRRLGFVNYIKDIFRPGVDERYIVNEESDLAKLHAYRCDNCGRTLYPAIGREKKFFSADFKCPSCGADRDTFYDIYDPTDPRNYDDDDEVPPDVLELWAKEEEEDLRALGLDPATVNLSDPDAVVAPPAAAVAEPEIETPPTKPEEPEQIEEKMTEISDVDREALKNLLSDDNFKQTLEEEKKEVPRGLTNYLGAIETGQITSSEPSVPKPEVSGVEEVRAEQGSEEVEEEMEEVASQPVEETLIGAGDQDNLAEETLLGASQLPDEEDSFENTVDDASINVESAVESSSSTSKEEEDDDFDILAL
mmetsp:Transcript_11390/g.14815  ORF Transcript_11390/g.14815 Transcript_11390/m.14815 type:complete len:471 (+) Transcript_11390:166-1578(+)